MSSVDGRKFQKYQAGSFISPVAYFDNNMEFKGLELWHKLSFLIS